jgi:exoribonuclease-2
MKATRPVLPGIEAPDLTIVSSRVEMVKAVENLRHDTCRFHFNENTLAADSGHPRLQI